MDQHATRDNPSFPVQARYKPVTPVAIARPENAHLGQIQDNWIHSSPNDEMERAATASLQDNSSIQKDSLTVLRQKTKRLEAELALLEEKSFEFVTNDALQSLLLNIRHHERFSQLKKCLTFIRAQRSELTDQIAKETESRKLLEETNEALKKKVSDVDVRIVTGTDSSVGKVVGEMRADINKISKESETYKSLLFKLLAKYFPAPVEDTQSGVRKKRSAKIGLNHSRSCDTADLSSLKSIIKLIVEETLNSPANPYIAITEHMLPEHIEFLLRSQIVRKHPEDPMKMKLVPFHL